MSKVVQMDSGSFLDILAKKKANTTTGTRFVLFQETISRALGRNVSASGATSYQNTKPSLRQMV